MSNNTDPKIQEIRDRHSKATSSPWYYDLGGYAKSSIVYDKNDVIICSLPNHSHEILEADAVFISGSHADIAYLLSEIERLQTAQDKVKTELEYIAYVCLDKRCIKAAEEALSHLKG